MYGKSWACPPAVGSVAACRQKALSYPAGLVFTTLCEVEDIANIEQTLATRKPHEEITRQVRDILLQQSPDVLTLSTEACAICAQCSYPDGPCRHPDRMFPCVESYGIVATDLAEKNSIEFYNGNLVTWFSVLLYRYCKKIARSIAPGNLCMAYSISSRLDVAGTSFCFGSVTHRTPSL